MKLNTKLLLVLSVIISASSFADNVNSIDSQNIINQDPIKTMPNFVPGYFGEVIMEQPKGICVFDIDQTLIAPTSASWPNDKKFPDNDEYKLLPGGEYRIAPYARSAFYECIKHGYGIGLNSAGNYGTIGGGREQMLDYLFSDTSQFWQAAANGLQQALINGSKKYTEGNSIYQNFVSDKSGAMVSIMKAYDKNVIVDPDTTKCVVLFDDNPKYIENIQNYNKRFTPNHRLIAIELDKAGGRELGVTETSFRRGVDALKANGCRWGDVAGQGSGTTNNFVYQD